MPAYELYPEALANIEGLLAAPRRGEARSVSPFRMWLEEQASDFLRPADFIPGPQQAMAARDLAEAQALTEAAPDWKGQTIGYGLQGLAGLGMLPVVSGLFSGPRRAAMQAAKAPLTRSQRMAQNVLQSVEGLPAETEQFLQGIVRPERPAGIVQEINPIVQDRAIELGNAFKNAEKGPARDVIEEQIQREFGGLGSLNAIIGGDRAKLGGLLPRQAGRIGSPAPQGGLMSMPEQTMPGQISTRFPTAVKATEDPMTHDLIVGMGSMSANPAALAHNVNLMTEYPNYQRRGLRRPEAKAEQLIEHERENLNWLHDRFAPEFRERSRLWYDGARRIADEAAEQYGVTPESAAGVYAALSPQKDWFMNVSLGDRVMDIYQNQGNFGWSKEMNTNLDRLMPNLKSKPAQAAAENIRGKTLSELTNPVDKALWIRMYDQSHNPRSYAKVTPEGDRLDIVTTAKGEPGQAAWGGVNTIASAVSVLDNPNLENISRQMGAQHKVRNFYNNIIAPTSERGDVTIDTHAVAAGLLSPYAGSDIPVLHNFGGAPVGLKGPASSAITGNQGMYGLHAEAYRRAAQDQGILPREMQSITWEAVRGLFSNKSAKQKARAAAIWDEFKRGRINQQQAQNLIFESAGGINAPAWSQ